MARSARLTASRLGQLAMMSDADEAVIRGLLAEVQRIIELLDAHRSSGLRVDQSDPLMAGLAAELEDRRLIVISEDKAIRELMTRAKRVGSGNLSLKLSRAERLMREGVELTGYDRREALGDALGQLRELTETEDGGREGLVWLLVGWLRMALGPDSVEATAALSQASVLFAARRDALSALSLRLLAWAQGPYQGYGMSLATAQRALGYSRDPGLILDAVNYAEQSESPQEAKPILTAGIKMHGTLALEALALTESMGRDEATFSVRLNTIREGFAENHRRVESANEALGEARREAIKIYVAANLTPPTEAPLCHDSNCGLLGAGLKVVWAVDEARRVRQRGLAAVEEALSQQASVVQERRDALRKEQEKGEKRMEALTGKVKSAEERLKGELAKFDSTESSAEQSAMMSVKLGVGLLVGLFLANAFMSAGGRGGFLQGPVLVVSLLVAGAPAIGAILMQMGRAAARVALENDLQKVITRARDEERRQRGIVERETEKKLLELREHLTEGEKRYEELKMVWMGLQPEEKAA